MPQETHSGDTKIDQRPMPFNLADRDGDVVIADPSIANKDYLAELAFMEEPVVIRLEPSSDQNAPNVFEVWVNGVGAEVLRNGRWVSITWLPVGEVITIKRKVVEVIARTKKDTIRTVHGDATQANPFNREIRQTSAVRSFSVISDANPRGAIWLSEMLRRNF
jgi:hypothetical protein